MKSPIYTIVLLSLLFSSCLIQIDIDPKPEKKLYKTLIRKSPWRIAELTISLYHNNADDTPYWDTTLYNWGTLTFNKFLYDDFDSTLDFTEDFDDLNLSNHTKMVKDKLYLAFQSSNDLWTLGNAGGYADTKKGDEINIDGEKFEWYPNNRRNSFRFAPFLTETAYYKCDWKLLAD